MEVEHHASESWVAVVVVAVLPEDPVFFDCRTAYGRSGPYQVSVGVVLRPVGEGLGIGRRLPLGSSREMDGHLRRR